MTKSSITHHNFAPGTSRGPRNLRTLALQMALAEERQREIGARIKELRGPKPQQKIADAVGVTLRAYQAWEAGDSGIAWENLEKLAVEFDVTEDYIIKGPADTTAGTQLDRIEVLLLELNARLEHAGFRLPAPDEIAAAEADRLAGTAAKAKRARRDTRKTSRAV